jgi:hypothetical protein
MKRMKRNRKMWTLTISQSISACTRPKRLWIIWFVQPLSELDFWVIEPDPLATPLVPALFFVTNPEMPAPVSPLPVPQWIASDANLILKVD